MVPLYVPLDSAWCSSKGWRQLPEQENNHPCYDDGSDDELNAPAADVDHNAAASRPGLCGAQVPFPAPVGKKNRA